MNSKFRRRFAVCLIALLSSPLLLLAEEPQAMGGLVKFESKEGGFSALLPGKPAYETKTVGKEPEVQHQFKIGATNGVYLISYQENPNLKGATPEELGAVLKLGRDRMLQTFGGKLIESKNEKFDKKHPGLAFRVTIPAAAGEARCKFYLVETRLYQVISLGTPEFAGSDEATRVLDSFKLLP